MKPFLIIIVIIISSCKNQKNSDDEKKILTFKFPKNIDSLKYVATQRSLRQEIISNYNDTIKHAIWKGSGHSKSMIKFFEYCLKDSAVTVPRQYNLDTKKEFVAHNYQSVLEYEKGGKKIFKTVITKQLFEDFVEPDLFKFGILRHLEGAGNFDVSSDSIDLYYEMVIPATGFKEYFIVQSDFKGNYKLFPHKVISGVVR